MSTKKKYFGFYWTLPVFWAGFSDLPSDVEEAMRKSKTIRYQAQWVRRWVLEKNGELIGERAYLETEPDRATESVRSEIQSILKICRDRNAEIIMVNFSEVYGWRPHHYIENALKNEQYTIISPIPIMMDGKSFDPISHFRQWRAAEEERRKSKKSRRNEIWSAIEPLVKDNLPNSDIANKLNAASITTITGKKWSPDGVRKFRRIMQSD